MSETTHRALRLAFASLLLVALIAQLAIAMSRNDLGVVDFFSSFTILSNCAAVVLLVMLAARPGRSEGTPFSMFRGAVTVYMTATGLLYATLLTSAGIDAGLTEPWIDWSLHVIGPAGLIADWVAFPPPHRQPGRAVLLWVAFPVAYLAYTLTRGAIIDWYPYPFLDPAGTSDYVMVALWCGVALVAIVGFGAATRWWANRRVEAAA